MSNTPVYEDSLLVLEFFNKLDNNEDYTTEFDTIKTWEEDRQREVVSMIFERATQYIEDVSKYLKPIFSLGFICQRYMDDFAWAISYKIEDGTQPEKAVEKIKAITAADPYEKSMEEGFFWQRVAVIAIGTKDRSILSSVISKIESVKDRF